MMRGDSYDLMESLLSQDVPGDIVEVGCNNGITSLFLASLTDGIRNLYCFDCFEDLQTEGVPEAKLSVFQSRFLEYPKVKSPVVCVGRVEKTIPGSLPNTIALALIDCDFYEAIKHSLFHILPRMSPKGTILVHDWEQDHWMEGVQRAVREIWKGPVEYSNHLAIIRS